MPNIISVGMDGGIDWDHPLEVRTLPAARNMTKTNGSYRSYYGPCLASRSYER